MSGWDQRGDIEELNQRLTIHAIDEHHLHVGDRDVWWGDYHSDDMEGSYPWKLRQFIVRFESKWSVSVIWGFCTYSDNYNLPWYHGEQAFTETPATVEAAVFHADRQGIQCNDGEPFCYLTAQQLNTLLTMVSMLGTEDAFEVLEL